MHWKQLPYVAVAFVLALLGAVAVAARQSDEGSAAAPAAADARLKVAHLAPFGADEDGTSVSIRIDGSDVLTEVVFADVSGYLPLPAGVYEVTVVPTGASTPAITQSVTLEAGKDYTAAAVGDGANQSLELLALEDDNAPLADNAKLRIVHAAPFAADLNDTRVDVRFQDGTPVAGLSDIPFKAIGPIS
ncbi:DUF4397 domain-containing protein, partial [Candidatus Gracilibacteria bacterium]|nr:DUF4397 domain-containing protein [Candidatus Gracilibacteria bacterium]